MKLFSNLLLLVTLLSTSVGSIPSVAADACQMLIPSNSTNLNSENANPFDTKISINPEMSTRWLCVKFKESVVDHRNYNDGNVKNFSDVDSDWFDEDWTCSDNRIRTSWADTTGAWDHDGLYGRWCYVPIKIDVFLPATSADYKIKLDFKFGYDPTWAGASFARCRGANLWYFTDKDNPLVSDPKGYPHQISDDCYSDNSGEGYTQVFKYTHKSTGGKEYDAVTESGSCTITVTHRTGISEWVPLYFGFALAQRRHDQKILGQNSYLKNIWFGDVKATESKFHHYLYNTSEDYNEGFDSLNEALDKFNQMTEGDEAILYVGDEGNGQASCDSSTITGSGIIDCGNLTINVNAKDNVETAFDIHPIDESSSPEPNQMLIFRNAKSIKFNGPDLKRLFKIGNSTSSVSKTTHSTVELLSVFNSAKDAGVFDDNGLVCNNDKLNTMFELDEGCRVSLSTCILSANNSASAFQSYFSANNGSHDVEICIVDSAFYVNNKLPYIVDISQSSGHSKVFLGGSMKPLEKYFTSGNFKVLTTKENEVYTSDAQFYGDTLYGDTNFYINLSGNTKWKMGDIAASNTSKRVDDDGKIIFPKLFSDTIDDSLGEGFGEPILKYFAVDRTTRASSSKCKVTFEGLTNQGAIVIIDEKEKDIGKGIQDDVPTDKDFSCRLRPDEGYQRTLNASVVVWDGKPGQAGAKMISTISSEAGLFQFSPITGNVFIDQDALCGPYIQVLNEKPATLKRSIETFTPHCNCEFDDDYISRGGADIENPTTITVNVEGSYSLPSIDQAKSRVKIYNIKDGKELDSSAYTYTPEINQSGDDPLIKKATITIKEGKILDDLIVSVSPTAEKTNVVNEGDAYQLSGASEVHGGENYIATYTSPDPLSSYLSQYIKVYLKFDNGQEIDLVAGKDYFWELEYDGLFGKLTVLADSISADLHINVGLNTYSTVTFAYCNDNLTDSPFFRQYAVDELVCIASPEEGEFVHEGQTFMYWRHIKAGGEIEKYYPGDYIYAPKGDQGYFTLEAVYKETPRNVLDVFVQEYVHEVPVEEIEAAYVKARDVFNDFDDHTRITFSTQANYASSFNLMRSWAQKVGEDYNFSTDKFGDVK